MSKIIRVESGLKSINSDENILNYVCIARVNFIVDLRYGCNFYISCVKLSKWGSLIYSMNTIFNSCDGVCICGKKNIKDRYLVVHKDKIEDIKIENIITIGSSCKNNIINYINSSNGFGDFFCSANFKKCEFKKFSTIKNKYKTESEQVIAIEYYGKSSLYNKCGVCFQCSHKFKEILMMNSPSNIFRNKSIYMLLKNEYGKKQLLGFISFLKSKKKCDEEKWRDWVAVANVCLT